MQPTIMNGDVVMLDTGRKRIFDGQIYALALLLLMFLLVEDTWEENPSQFRDVLRPKGCQPE